MTIHLRAGSAWPLLAAVLIGHAPSEASAQSSSSGGGGRAPTGSPLTFGISLFSARESAPAGEAGPLPEQGRLKVSFDYARARRRHTLNLFAGSVVPYSNGISDRAVSYAVALRFSSQLGRRTRLDATDSIGERPLDGTGIAGYSLTAAGAPNAVSQTLTTNAGLTVAREMRHDSAVTIARTLTRRSSAALSFTHTRSSSPGLRAASSQLVSARMEHRVSASSVLHAGYGFGTASFGTAETAAGVRHDLDCGFAYTSALPFSPRTELAAGTGSTVLTDRRGRKLRLEVFGSLSRELASTWSARVEYRRPMQFVAGFQQPFLSDAIGMNVDGRIGHAWFLSLTSGVARGSVGFRAGAPAYDSYTGSVRAQRQIARAWRAEVEGFATRFRFGGGAAAESPLLSRVMRRGVRAGVSWSSTLSRR